MKKFQRIQKSIKMQALKYQKSSFYLISRQQLEIKGNENVPALADILNERSAGN